MAKEPKEKPEVKAKEKSEIKQKEKPEELSKEELITIIDNFNNSVESKRRQINEIFEKLKVTNKDNSYNVIFKDLEVTKVYYDHAMIVQKDDNSQELLDLLLSHVTVALINECIKSEGFRRYTLKMLNIDEDKVFPILTMFRINIKPLKNTKK